MTFEEGAQAAWLYEIVRPRIAEVIVCNPRMNKLLAVDNKANRVDAHKLAELLRCGQLNQEAFQMAEPAQSTDQFQLGGIQCSAKAVQDSLATDYRVSSDEVGRFLAQPSQLGL